MLNIPIPRSRLVAWVGPLLIAAVVVTGCGGGGSSPSLTKAEYLKKADAICKRFEQERLSAIKAFTLLHKGNLASRALQEDLVEEAALPPIRSGVEKLAALGSPKSGVNDATAFIETYEEAVDRIAENATFALNGDPFAKVRKVSRAYGFKECGKI